MSLWVDNPIFLRTNLTLVFSFLRLLPLEQMSAYKHHEQQWDDATRIITQQGRRIARREEMTRMSQISPGIFVPEIFHACGPHQFGPLNFALAYLRQPAPASPLRWEGVPVQLRFVADGG